jgi:hypothetical protein
MSVLTRKAYLFPPFREGGAITSHFFYCFKNKN